MKQLAGVRGSGRNARVVTGGVRAAGNAVENGAAAGVSQAGALLRSARHIEAGLAGIDSRADWRSTVHLGAQVDRILIIDRCLTVAGVTHRVRIARELAGPPGVTAGVAGAGADRAGAA